MERRKISDPDIASRRIRRPCGFTGRYFTRRAGPPRARGA